MTTHITEKPKQNAISSSDGNKTAITSEFAKAGPRKRTLGLWLVDALIYPLVNNFGVFGISVFATYLTDHGWPMPADGKPLAKWKQTVGDAFQSRGKRLDALFESKLNMPQEAASMSRMVFFSFFDGTFVAPFVKLLEDRREKMAYTIDSALGTKPKDESVYDAEPKQSWRSVVEGRLLTSLIVVPTAALLSKEAKTGNSFLKAGQSLNDKFFKNPGLELGAKIETSMPKLKNTIEKIFGQVHFPTFFKIGIFEAFYTSVCTVGLYVISRGVARKHPNPHPHKANIHNTLTPNITSRDEAPAIDAELPAKQEIPENKINTTTHLERLAQPEHTTELTA